MDKHIFSFRTDMADERVDEYKTRNNLSNVDGIKVETQNIDKIKIVTVDVLNENGSKSIGKEIGKYITIEMPNVGYLENDETINITKKISDLIRQLIFAKLSNFKNILIVGLGNKGVTPDALGPEVVLNVTVTRHILKYAKELNLPICYSVAAIAPGVMGTTGIETEEIVNAVVKNIKPDLIIAIDSLASGSIDRVGKTIQLSNTGITPGQGVGNKRKGLNEKNLGIPVIAIGVPTVVDMATITSEVMDKIDGKEDIERHEKIASILDNKNYMVTPKEIDVIIQNISSIISNGINMCFDV